MQSEYPLFCRKAARRYYLYLHYKKSFKRAYKRTHRHITDTIILIWKNMDNRDRAIEKGQFESVVYLTGRIQDLVKVLVKFQNENYFRRLNVGDDITREMVQRAKNYPFENLIELKRGMASCPFHEDKKPSFSVKDNRGHCFSCHWSGDTIAFLMKKDGLSFREAVKALQ